MPARFFIVCAIVQTQIIQNRPKLFLEQINQRRLHATILILNIQTIHWFVEKNLSVMLSNVLVMLGWNAVVVCAS